MSMYITGDTHGLHDIDKIVNKKFGNKKLSKKDYMVICGDAGIVWDGKNFDSHVQDWWNERPWTTLYVDGNHENHYLLNHLPTEEWNGGKVHRISDSIIHLCRGQVFEIDGKKIFTMGGADSVDKHLRIEGRSWWKEELPSQKEYDEALDNLEKHNHKVDYIFTHCAPSTYLDSINPYYTVDHLNKFLGVVEESTEYYRWYCGHYHIDKTIGPLRVLYENVVKLY